MPRREISTGFSEEKPKEIVQRGISPNNLLKSIIRENFDNPTI
jgi:hypothetical protein